MLSWCAFVLVFAQAGPAVPNPTRQEPLLVAEEVFTATVLSVEDGDSIVVQTGGERMALDLAGVDAPEAAQQGGPDAKQFLSALTLGKTVTVRLTGAPDRFARISVNGVDVTEALIRAGMGWHCPRFADERNLVDAEADARGARRGLWRAARPTPPWLYRGAGACWQKPATPRVSSQARPDFMRRDGVAPRGRNDAPAGR
jgi:endonuclease YncB( thermonuclease family)